MPSSHGSKGSTDSSTVGISQDLSAIDVETPNNENSSLVESSDHESSRGFDTSHTPEESTSSNDRSDMSPALAAKESKQVFRSKILVYLVLLVSAATVAGFTYYFLSQEEKNDFETQVRSCICSTDRDIIDCHGGCLSRLFFSFLFPLIPNSINLSHFGCPD